MDSKLFFLMARKQTTLRLYSEKMAYFRVIMALFCKERFKMFLLKITL